MNTSTSFPILRIEVRRCATCGHKERVSSLFSRTITLGRVTVYKPLPHRPFTGTRIEKEIAPETFIPCCERCVDGEGETPDVILRRWQETLDSHPLLRSNSVRRTASKTKLAAQQLPTPVEDLL